nr:CreA family protein [uncultured Roseovarius sp.]
MGRIGLWLGVVAIAALPRAALSDQVGEIGVDWAGNDIVIEAVRDPKVNGVTCHLAYFSRGVIDRLANGNWFEDPSNSALECQQTGPITLGNIDRSEGGEDVFRTSRSIVLKSLRVKRIYDAANHTLIYVAHTRELTQGSAKVSISTVPIPQGAADGK